jgi:hypothetical protein
MGDFLYLRIMNYQLIHDSIIDRAKTRVLPKETYTERHHIIPRCMGGSDDKSNLVDLTAKEHFIVHKLLVETHPESDQMKLAIWFMSNTINSEGRNYRVSAMEYERYKILISRVKTKDQDVFINELKVIYGDKYDYGKVVYLNQNYKVTLVCQKHGDFKQWPTHLLNSIGCQKCSMEEQVKKMIKPLHKFVSQSDVVHDGKYDYSKVVYNGAKNKVEIVCHDHGSFFMTPDNHINGGNGCKECGKIKVSELQKKIKRGDRSKSKIVLDINTGVFYDCALDVAELYGVNNSTMTSWLNGKRTNKTSFRYV